MESRYFDFFFIRATEYYLRKLEIFKTGKKVSFNLFPFLFGFLWFIYRKMYWQAVILFFIIYAINFVEQTVLLMYFPYNYDAQIAVQLLTTITFGILTGIFGNWFYIQHASRKIKKITEKNEGNEEEIIKEIKKSGGVSHLWLTIAILIFVAIQILANLIV